MISWFRSFMPACECAAGATGTTIRLPLQSDSLVVRLRAVRFPRALTCVALLHLFLIRVQSGNYRPRLYAPASVLRPLRIWFVPPLTRAELPTLPPGTCTRTKAPYTPTCRRLSTSATTTHHLRPSATCHVPQVTGVN